MDIWKFFLPIDVLLFPLSRSILASPLFCSILSVSFLFDNLCHIELRMDFRFSRTIHAHCCVTLAHFTPFGVYPSTSLDTLLMESMIYVWLNQNDTHTHTILLVKFFRADFDLMLLLYFFFARFSCSIGGVGGVLVLFYLKFFFVATPSAILFKQYSLTHRGLNHLIRLRTLDIFVDKQ